MVCKSCGKTLRSGEKFCTVCGCYNDFDEEEENPEAEETKEELENLGDSIKELERELEEDKKKEEVALEKEKIKEEKKKEKERLKEEKRKEKEAEVVETEEEIVEVSFKNDKKKKVKEDILDTLSVEERPLGLFIGEDYKWVVQRPFNVFAMLFSWVYFLYRKVYLIGILGLIIVGVIVRFVPILTIPVIIVSMVGVGFLFNKVYLSIAEKRISKIQDKYSDQYTCEKELRKKGGVNAIIAILIFILFLGIMFLSYFNFGALKKNSKYATVNSDNIANCRSIGRQIYQNLEVYQVEGTFKEAACEVLPSVNKEFRIYFVLTTDNVDTYLLFETGNDLISIKANTSMIDRLENIKEKYGLAESDEEFLKESKQVRNNYQQTITDSKNEEKLIKQNKDNSERTHYVLTKDDIIG